jgi:hypothetical protein
MIGLILKVGLIVMFMRIYSILFLVPKVFWVLVLLELEADSDFVVVLEEVL